MSASSELPTLVSLRYSPWSERARWALDHHELAGGEALMESFEIARFADHHGAAEALLPAPLEPAIRELNELVERALTEGRSLTIAALLADPAAIEETLPRAVPAFLRPLLRSVSRVGTRWLARKYGLELCERPRPLAELGRALDYLRQRYAGCSYFFERFSYADIVFCSLHRAVSPVDDRYIRLGPAWRRAWTIPELAGEYSDLAARRDELYARHRKRRVKSALTR